MTTLHHSRPALFIGWLVVLLTMSAANPSPAETTPPMRWPDLPASGFVSGRAATEDDVKAGNAVFVLRSRGQLVGKPLKLEVPQYAIHVDAESGQQTPGFIIQAESAGDQSLVGFLELPGRTMLAGTLPEFKLLGTKRPDLAMPQPKRVR